MDWIKPGLPKKALGEIRATNTISTNLFRQLKSLNEQLSVFLQTNTPPLADTPTQQIFQDFYYSINGTEKLTKFPSLSITRISEFNRQLSRTNPESDFDQSLAKFIREFLVVLAAHELANCLIVKAIVYNSHVTYWSNVRLSKVAQATYGVQIFPKKTYDFICSGFRETVFLAAEERTIFERARGGAVAVASTFRSMVASFFSTLSNNLLLRTSWLRWLHVPFTFIDRDIKHKIHGATRQLDGQYDRLGLFVTSLPVNEATLAKVLGLKDPTLCAVLTKIEEEVLQKNEPFGATAPPGVLTRFWPVIGLLAWFGPSTSSSAWHNRDAIVQWVRLNLVDTVYGFWKNWIVKPVWDMMGILRADDSMTITSKESLRSDLDSLERMVMDFLQDNHINASTEQVHDAVAQGDLTMMMSQYENEIKTPYRLIINGLLVRSILIQIQKTKVDGGTAISGIDKLLKSQQLLFGALSILPSLFVLYQINRAIHKDPSMSQDMRSRRIECLKGLNEITALVNRETEYPRLIVHGRLFVALVTLTLLLKKVIPTRLHSEWLRDLNELMVTSVNDEKKAAKVLERVWYVYSPFFR